MIVYDWATTRIINRLNQEGFSLRILPDSGQVQSPWYEANTETAPIVNIGRKVFALYNGQYYEAVVRSE